MGLGLRLVQVAALFVYGTWRRGILCVQHFAVAGNRYSVSWSRRMGVMLRLVDETVLLEYGMLLTNMSLGEITVTTGVFFEVVLKQVEHFVGCLDVAAR